NPAAGRLGPTIPFAKVGPLMLMTNLKGITKVVVRRAQRQGSVSPRDVREELGHAGLPKTLWKDVVSLARPALSYRDGRYHFVAAVSAPVRAEQRQQRAIQRAVRRLVRQHKHSADQTERRREGRTDFIQPVKVQTEDQRAFTLLSRDLSVTGIRL